MVTNRNISWFDSNISQRWTLLSVSLSMRYKSPKTAGLISPIFWMRPLEACAMGCLPRWRWVLVKVDQCVKLIKQANIIWHFASRGNAGAGQRLALADFQALLDAKVRIYMIGWWLADKLQWQPPETAGTKQPSTISGGFLAEAAQSTYNFIQGGIAGGIGAYVSLIVHNLWYLLITPH